LNAERLNVLAKAVQNELSSPKIIEHITELMNATQNLAQQPQNPSFQQIIASKLRELEDLLPAAPSNSFPPAWRQILFEIGEQGLLGLDLAEKIAGIYAKNQITPTAALEEIRKVHQAISNFKSGIDHVVAGLQILKIGADELGSGQAEVGVEIPRVAVSNDLIELAKELGELRFILATFVELSTGQSGPIPLRTISSTDLQFYFSAIPSVAAALAYSLNLLVDAYKKVVEIRNSHAALKESDAPEEVLKPIEEYANRAVEQKLEGFAVEIEQRYCHIDDAHRRNEVKAALRISLAKLANRIDRGYHVEVRISQNPPAKESPESQREEFKEAAATIKAASPAMQYIRLEGEPILSLPDAENSDLDEDRVIADTEKAEKKSLSVKNRPRRTRER
jgi:hypothetical protein